MELTPFTYGEAQFRVLDVDGAPEFVAVDAARILGYSEASAMTRTLDDDEKGLRTVQTPGGMQQVLTITEAGLYSAILRSRIPEVRAFKRWVTHDLLPTVRKTGAYSTEKAEHQVNAQIFQSRARIELLQAARGLIHPDHLEAQARCVLAIGLGEHAELPADTRPLYTQDYLREKNLTATRIRSVSGMFGKRVKAAYVEEHGAPPAKYPLQLGNGQVRDVLAYTEQDRPLLDAVYNRYYSEVSA